MNTRRKARETTLHLLFQWEMTGDAPERVQEAYWQLHWDLVKQRRARAGRTSQRAVEQMERVRGSADELFKLILDRREEIDELLQKNAANWRLDRLSAVDRNIMRVTIGEIFARPTLSTKIAISEALEVARRYSSEDSVHFINGVLDAVRRDLQLKRT